MDTPSTSQIITLFVVILSGASGTYLLLPHGQGKAKPKLAHWVGLGLSAVATLAFMLFLKGSEIEFVSRVFLVFFSLASVACAFLTITSRDPVHSALWFAAVVLATSGLFLLSGAQFLAAGTVIVYAGAIIVTFLFVIMLAQKEGRAVYDRMSRAPFLATLSGFLLLFALMYPLLGMRLETSGQEGSTTLIGYTGSRLASTANRLDPVGHPDLFHQVRAKPKLVLERSMSDRSKLPEATLGAVKPAHVASLGTALFTDHLLTVEIAGSLLFVALIGALTIATPKPPIRPASLLEPASKIA